MLGRIQYKRFTFSYQSKGHGSFMDQSLAMSHGQSRDNRKWISSKSKILFVCKIIKCYPKMVSWYSWYFSSFRKMLDAKWILAVATDSRSSWSHVIMQFQTSDIEYISYQVTFHIISKKPFMHIYHHLDKDLTASFAMQASRFPRILIIV